jgi:hypothetical protein
MPPLRLPGRSLGLPNMVRAGGLTESRWLVDRVRQLPSRNGVHDDAEDLPGRVKVSVLAMSQDVGKETPAVVGNSRW